ncbi:HAMP domain-containing histidine kinase [Mycobacterium sp. CBMA293]|uniref:sensor histidine kinase n=1 Tax=unclassified Mycolicibacterium TaxID=2636767 RepID=UPI0012DCD1C4|nr:MULTISPECIES: HAMP domain-containing sensor histidine kinase [unclassified Mycolicibacterium]MUL47716.1 HAMP domain-containing histidine kinase [Mycolicibacterium sp. CBMA 360]MUL61766.1 HAMP domain-containing histidine kinase [Mycolicibacterium sp. CBMA 335]MUL70830.1 HAMP domain-containing histidine kinase [Mycolicibacterium sp. CBMA 311]MUL92944.1 HAMP domain-containing histidine kinase [Mycolicibacterium sp. CBMA 230]MUM14408.1 HAMP domain-containing histidine kinase [Mycolicibacterium 
MTRLRAGIPLRLGLVAATVMLAALGLLASGVAVTSIMQHSMINRVDETLLDASRGWAQEPRRIPPTPLEGPNPARPPSNFYVRGIDPDGSVWIAVNDNDAQPVLPDNNDVGPKPVTVDSVNHSDVKWRAMTVRGPGGELTTVAIDLSDVSSTVRALAWSQVGIGAAVLLILAVAGYVAVHRSLRPLDEVERTAADIAAGQLDRRVPERDSRTEVGRLSLALNGMLAQIQNAVASSEQSAAAARTSEDRMRRFITDASHELRTPLTTIRGFAELYRQGAASDIEMLMSRIESEARRMGLLVEDLLLLARMDQQRPLEQRPVDLLILATDAVHDARSIAPQRKVSLQVFDGPGTPEVIGDEARLRQVLGNLVINAIQHTPESGGITVRVGTTDDDAVLEVCDEGPGLSSDDAHRIFERFYRTDSSRTRTSGGTGLGLSIVDSLVRAHHGTVKVTTALGEGCRFTVRLPRMCGGPASAEGSDDLGLSFVE